MMPENLKEEEIQKLEACRSEAEWTATCREIKKTRGGIYPPDWWPVMKESGRMDKILARFGCSSEITAQPLKLSKTIYDHVTEKE